MMHAPIGRREQTDKTRSFAGVPSRWLSRVAPGRYLAVVVFVMLGCRAGADPNRAQVTGRLTFQGNPVAGATVTFEPATGSGPSYQAVTDADGAFEMQRHLGQGRYQSGIEPGEYRVSVLKLDTRGMASMTEPPKNLLPEKYADARTSGLTMTATVSGNNEFPIDL